LANSVKAYEQAIAVNPGSDVFHFVLGEAFLKNGHNKKADQKDRVLQGLSSAYSNRLRKDIEMHPNPHNFDFSGIEELLSECDK
jgi:hypothetical protein